jgi:hypothetical protein
MSGKTPPARKLATPPTAQGGTGGLFWTCGSRLKSYEHRLGHKLKYASWTVFSYLEQGNA